MPTFATVTDYADRYGEPADQKRVGVLLADASDYLCSKYLGRYGTEYEEGAHTAFDSNAKAVCCGIVSRMLATPTDLYGVSQYSQGTGSYSASMTYSNPTGDMYLTAAEKSRLGLVGGRVRSIQAAVSGGSYDAAD